MINLINEVKNSLMTPEDREIRDLLRKLATEKRNERIRNEGIRMNKLYNGLNYELNLYYVDTKKSFEEISIEGYTNTISLYDTYRKIGFNIGLRKVTIMLDGKKVKSVNFKY